jgi:hypothetical protein
MGRTCSLCHSHVLSLCLLTTSSGQMDQLHSDIRLAQKSLWLPCRRARGWPKPSDWKMYSPLFILMTCTIIITLIININQLIVSPKAEQFLPHSWYLFLYSLYPWADGLADLIKILEKAMQVSFSPSISFLVLFIYLFIGTEVWTQAYTLNHSTSPFLW